MTATYGLLSSGFVVKPLTVIKSELEADFSDAFGDGLDLDASSPAGQLVLIFAERLAELWELAEVMATAQDPDHATGAILDGIAAITGTTREPATKGTVTLTLCGTDGTTVAAGKVIADAVYTDQKWNTLAEAVIAIVPVWVTGTTYAAGDRVRNNATDYTYQCTVGGTSTVVPTGTAVDLDTADGLSWTFLGDTEGCVDVLAEASVTGPVAALARALTVIDTPVSGWSSVVNVEPADAGTDIETDPAMRVRRVVELVGSQGSILDSIRAEVLAVTGVTECTVYENTGTTTDGDGVPPKSIEAVVVGGADDDIAAAVFKRAAGIFAHGDESGFVTDAEGAQHEVFFSRPTDVDIYLEVHYWPDADFPVDGEAQIEAAIVAMADGLRTGQDVNSAMCERVSWITGVTNVDIYIDDAAAPTTRGTVTITSRQRAAFAAARIDFVEET